MTYWALCVDAEMRANMSKGAEVDWLRCAPTDLSTLDLRLVTRLFRDLGREHAAAEVVAKLRESAPASVGEAAFETFYTASRIVDAYPTALILALADQIEQHLEALPGHEQEVEAVCLRADA